MLPALKKKENTGELQSFKNNNNQKVLNTELEQVKAYVNNAADYYFFKVNEDWLAINNQHKEDLQILQRYLYIKKSGIQLSINIT